MKEKREYWQAIRGTCILAVVLIHSLGGFDYSASYGTEFLILRQIINFTVAVFVFMAGYFVNIDKLTNKEKSVNWLFIRLERLCIPFVIWSLVYSGLDLLKNVHSEEEINWIRYAYRFIVGKSAVPFYYIVVLMQMTLHTPMIVKVVKKNSVFSKILWLVTPIYLFFVYAWNYIVGAPPRLYETLFPAWFGFYYLGVFVKCGKKFSCSGYMVIGSLLLSIIEALGLRCIELDIGFYTSQITVGSFLYSATMIGWLLKKSKEKSYKNQLLVKVGDCSYGIFYIHMVVLMVVGRFIECDNWYVYWLLRFTLTAIISFGVIFATKKILHRHKELLRHVGFV